MRPVDHGRRVATAEIRELRLQPGEVVSNRARLAEEAVAPAAAGVAYGDGSDGPGGWPRERGRRRTTPRGALGTKARLTT